MIQTYSESDSQSRLTSVGQITTQNFTKKESQSQLDFTVHKQLKQTKLEKLISYALEVYICNAVQRLCHPIEINIQQHNKHAGTRLVDWQWVAEYTKA